MGNAQSPPQGSGGRRTRDRACRCRSSARGRLPYAGGVRAEGGGRCKDRLVGQLKIDGHSVVCGTRPTVLDSTLDDFGAAYPGFLILNPKLLAKLKSTPVKLWIHAHECGHQFRGPDEETADCFAVQRGRRQGWLTPEGLDEICRFMAPAKGDNVHFTGTQRCQAMRECYADRSVR